MGEHRIHPLAATGFATAGEAYESGRPGYPKALLDHIREVASIGPSTRVLDLAAGTGKLTKLLVDSGARVTAIEPLEDMRKSFSTVVPDVEILDGTAELIPVEDGVFRAVTVAQAFHWFDQKRAASEIQRVLENHGWLFLIWNTGDKSYEWMSRISEIVDPIQASVPDYETQDWQGAVKDSGLFGPIEHIAFPNLHEVNRQIVEFRFASSSYIANLEEAERSILMSKILQVIDTDPATSGKAKFWMPYVTDAYRTQKN
ncbi:MAG TPA: class I SAM-dependent methyltransferase [Actinomycetota bacterium]|nr:class I SAM-dependent methyltransferase [Actinomycetota bacterium]